MGLSLGLGVLVGSLVGRVSVKQFEDSPVLAGFIALLFIAATYLTAVGTTRDQYRGSILIRHCVGLVVVTLVAAFVMELMTPSYTVFAALAAAPLVVVASANDVVKQRFATAQPVTLAAAPLLFLVASLVTGMHFGAMFVLFVIAVEAVVLAVLRRPTSLDASKIERGMTVVVCVAGFIVGVFAPVGLYRYEWPLFVVAGLVMFGVYAVLMFLTTRRRQLAMFAPRPAATNLVLAAALDAVHPGMGFMAVLAAIVFMVCQVGAYRLHRRSVARKRARRAATATP
jgi:hypothetical protein